VFSWYFAILGFSSLFLAFYFLVLSLSSVESLPQILVFIEPKAFSVRIKSFPSSLKKK